MPIPIDCVIMRGGTSKAAFPGEHDLPADCAVQVFVPDAMPAARKID